MKRVMTIYGTRPEAIKMAPLVLAIRETADLEAVVAVTGQHREMLDQVNDLFGIVPDHDLDLMVPGASLADLSSRALAATSALLGESRPDVVVVQGDTSSAFIGGLAAFYEGIPVVHLEVGLRSGNLQSPFPEEGNRRLLAPLSTLHLCPTPTSRYNLLREGIEAGQVVVTGNTVIDALQAALRRPAEHSDARVAALLGSEERILLVTAHRRESWGAPMSRAMQAVREVARRYPDLNVLVPMHRNGTVRAVIERALGDVPNVLLTEPLSYHEFAHALAASTLVLTDSGGVQEEAPSLGKPVLVMRDTTERPEAVAAGTVRLVGTDPDLVLGWVQLLLDDAEVYDRFTRAMNPYGDGRAAARSVAAIRHLLGLGDRLPEFVPEPALASGTSMPEPA